MLEPARSWCLFVAAITSANTHAFQVHPAVLSLKHLPQLSPDSRGRVRSLLYTVSKVPRSLSVIVGIFVSFPYQLVISVGAGLLCISEL